MTDDSKQQNELDQLIQGGHKLPDGGNEYIPLYKTLGASPIRLPSNFTHLVIQKIIRLKVERARSTAVSQSILISTLACLLSLGLLILYAIYTQSSPAFGLSLASFPSLLLPLGGALALLMLVTLDGFLVSARSRLSD